MLKNDAMNELENFIKAYWGLSGDDLTRIASYFKPTVLKKNEFYLKPGKICHTLSIQRSGIVRVYISDSEQEITQWISTKGGFVSDLSGLIFDQPSKYYIQALTDAGFYTMSHDDYVNIGHVIPQWHQLEKLFIARCFLFMEERIFSLLSMSTEQRYTWLFNHNPALFNEVPLQYLASMMGMTPETLSRIRKKNALR